MTDKIKFQFTVGALLRREVRAALETSDISYKEHKGLLDSIFVCEGTFAQYKAIEAWGKKVNGEN